MSSLYDKHIKHAFFYCVGYAVMLSFASLFVKLAEAHTTNSMIVFIRFAFSLTYIFAILGIKRGRGKPVTIKTKHFGMHLLRAFSSFSCQFSLFYALKYIPLVDANLLFLTNALFIPVLGAIFFGTKTTAKSWLAITVSFIGVLLVLKPGHEVFNPASLIALLAGFLAAISLLGIHEMAKDDSAHTIMFYYFSLTFCFSLILVSFNWQTLNAHTFWLLIAIGATSVLAQECSVRALMNAPAKIVAPLMYMVIIFSGLFDWILWKHVPDWLTLLGIVVVCFGSIMAVRARA